MDFRKVIKFGENSFVISLPNKWIKENKIKKGDVINLEIEDNILKIQPHTIKKEKNNISEKIIEYDKLKSIKHLKTHLTAAYINGYDQIVIIGRDITKDIPKIREFIKSFIAMEIIEQSNQRVVLKEFVNIYEVSLQDIIRRIDRIIISMAEDAEKQLNGEGDFIEVLKQKDDDIFRFHNFIFRTIKSIVKSPNLTEHKLKTDEILYYWELTIFLEKMADQLKRIPRYAPQKTSPEVIATLKEITQYYKDTMKANYTKDYLVAIDLINKRKPLYEKCEAMLSYLPKSSYLISEKMKNAVNHIVYLSKVLIKYTY